MKRITRISLLAVFMLSVFMFSACTGGSGLDEHGYYYSKDEVALFIHTYERLPDNYVTKDRARSYGWSGGSVEKYIKDAAIGGDRYSNYERKLPKNRYRECDIDTHGKKSRGGKRIIYSDDGEIYYTPDHYSTFEKLY